MEEYGKILTDAPIALGLEVLRRRTDDDPVMFLDRQAEQSVPDRAADLVNLHGRIIPRIMSLDRAC
jgi:hypothetical protein